ncbi:class I SAM-dependent methyltransferase [Paenibacillus glycanilyticus]|uniref:class I SAM-dependent methyltransferase n=1 Tax=Paenibacillus glycanilyticus TaxID=126569 RepID=UPI00203F35F6|nr:class I SAM-dependent methyltransferase [Paenibacillus glycanilyticus]MCM3626401.1 class I SAM-dependent methyltransferase [Paenibacillus glycanilyticus]
MANAVCRSCSYPLRHLFVDLRTSPLSNNFLRPEQLNQGTPYYPLRVFVCESCLLVQLEQFESPQEIFEEYAYFSSYSSSWLAHAKHYVDTIIPRLSLGRSSSVVEIASNDGYLLQYFSPYQIPVLGIEPARNVAKQAEAKGVPTVSEFFTLAFAKQLAQERGKADLIIGNNVLAHVPELQDFAAGLKELLSPAGTLTLEFPHLLRLMKENQFDTIYHEHFSYLSLLSVTHLFTRYGLTVYDVEEWPTHGGSLRVFVRHAEHADLAATPQVERIINDEIGYGLQDVTTYSRFPGQVKTIKEQVYSFLFQASRENKRVVAYGAPAKGNTLLNYLGVGTDYIDYAVDRNPYKQGLFMPGSRIPVYSPSRIQETKPDYILILPWNLKEEIEQELLHAREWGAKLVVCIPRLEIY